MKNITIKNQLRKDILRFLHFNILTRKTKFPFKCQRTKSWSGGHLILARLKSFRSREPKIWHHVILEFDLRSKFRKFIWKDTNQCSSAEAAQESSEILITRKIKGSNYKIMNIWDSYLRIWLKQRMWKILYGFGDIIFILFI